MKLTFTKAESKLSTIWAVLHSLVLVYAYTCLSIKAFFQYNSGGDYLWYHLPNGLLRWGLTDFTPSPYIQLICKTLPPLADWTEGLLVALTGSVKAGTGANALAFALVSLVLVALYRKQVSWRWLLTGFLAIPMFVIHFTNGYIDLFGACGIFLAFASLGLLHKPEKFVQAGLSFCFGLSVAVFSRYQTWPAACLLIAIAGFRILKLNKIPKARRIALMSLAFIIMAAWPVRNLVKFGSPTYPYKAPIVGRFFEAPIQMETLYKDQVPNQLQKRPQPIIFLYSMFELTRWDPNAGKYVWNGDQGSGAATADPHFRMGGWSIYTVLILLLFLTVGIVLRRFVWFELTFLGGILLFTSFMSQGHELRYFMFIPMCVVFLFAKYAEQLPERWSVLCKVLLLASAIHVCEKVHISRIKYAPMSDSVPEKIKAAWKAYDAAVVKKPLCGIDGPDSIYFTGPNLREYPVIDNDAKNCKGYFYDPQ